MNTMKKLTMATLIAVATMGTATVATTAPAAAREAFTFSFDTGNVAFAYSDGYYDHNRRWHRWHDAREAREYRAHFSDRYRHGPRSRYPNRGWYDSDHDGVPNRYDRDRDGDGVPNRFDDRPNNPYRR
jgi:hypothetical protein